MPSELYIPNPFFQNSPTTSGTAYGLPTSAPYDGTVEWPQTGLRGRFEALLTATPVEVDHCEQCSPTE